MTTPARLIDPDLILRRKIVEFVERGEFGLASGAKDGAQYERLWYAEPIGAEEVAFEASVFLVTKAKAQELRATPEGQPQPEPGPTPGPGPEPGPGDQKITLRLVGTVPPEVWNRLGTKVLPKLRSGDDLSVGIEFSVSVGSAFAKNMETELQQILKDLGLSDRVKIERS